MRFHGLVLAFLLILSTWPTLVAGTQPPSKAQGILDVSLVSPQASLVVLTPPSLVTAEFLVEPENGRWLSFPPSSIAVHVMNDTLSLLSNESTVLLDGASFFFGWDEGNRVLRAMLGERLSDGVHHVEADLAFKDRGRINIRWSFGVDTQVPELSIDPLPEVSTSLQVELRGSVTDPRLVGLTILGEEVTPIGGRFSYLVWLWPGLNDILIEAKDAAGNIARHTETTTLSVAPYDEPMGSWINVNASFSMDFPEAWTVQRDVILPSGTTAAIVAIAGLQPGIVPSVIVLTQPTYLAYPPERALQWMDLVLSALEANGDLIRVVSQSRIFEVGPGVKAVQSTFLRDEGPVGVAFTQVVMVWSHALDRQWVVLASIDSSLAHTSWAPLNATVSSFRILDLDTEPDLATEPDVTVPIAVAMGASVFLVALLAVVLLENRWRRWRKKANELWKPPKSWKR